MAAARACARAHALKRACVRVHAHARTTLDLYARTAVTSWSLARDQVRGLNKSGESKNWKAGNESDESGDESDESGDEGGGEHAKRKAGGANDDDDDGTDDDDEGGDDDDEYVLRPKERKKSARNKLTRLLDRCAAKRLNASGLSMVAHASVVVCACERGCVYTCTRRQTQARALARVCSRAVVLLYACVRTFAFVSLLNAVRKARAYVRSARAYVRSAR
eukprot:1222118-Pleurochrysis_carterae.AAC.2